MEKILLLVDSATLTDKLVFLVTFFGTLGGLLIGLKQYHDSRVAMAKEKSSGAAAMERIVKDLDELKQQMKEGKINDENLSRLINKIEEDYTFLMKKFFEFFKPGR